MLLKRFASSFLAVLCLCAIAVSSASANSNEIVNKEGKALVKKGFTGTVGESVLETVHKSKMTCKGGSTKGVVTGTKTIEATLTLTGCSSGGASCHTAGSKEGEVEAADADLVLLEAHELMVLSEKLKASIACGLTEIKTEGSFLIPVGSSQEDHLNTKYKFTAAQKEGIQIPTEYVNTKLEKIEYARSGVRRRRLQAGVATTLAIQFEEEAKFRLTRIVLIGNPRPGRAGAWASSVSSKSTL